MIMNRPASSAGGLSDDLASTADILNGMPEGERDDVLFRWACRLRRQVGDDGRRIVELAVLDVAARCIPPFPCRGSAAQGRASLATRSQRSSKPVDRVGPEMGKR